MVIFIPPNQIQGLVHSAYIMYLLAYMSKSASFGKYVNIQASKVHLKSHSLFTHSNLSSTIPLQAVYD
jgi:hypothetical protein